MVCCRRLWKSLLNTENFTAVRRNILRKGTVNYELIKSDTHA